MADASNIKSLVPPAWNQPHILRAIELRCEEMGQPVNHDQICAVIEAIFWAKTLMEHWGKRHV